MFTVGSSKKGSYLKETLQYETPCNLSFNRCTTISGHFFANYISIFHKTEIQTVILRCLTDLNLLWYKSYDPKRKKRTLRLTHQNSKVINGHFMTVSGHFFANNMSIFHKTKIQTVILRCSTSLKLNWYKS